METETWSCSRYYSKTKVSYRLRGKLAGNKFPELVYALITELELSNSKKINLEFYSFDDDFDELCSPSISPEEIENIKSELKSQRHFLERIVEKHNRLLELEHQNI